MRLINGISGMKSANLVGTVDRRGNINLALFNSVVQIGADPPYLGMIFRSLALTGLEGFHEVGRRSASRTLDLLPRASHPLRTARGRASRTSRNPE